MRARAVSSLGWAFAAWHWGCQAINGVDEFVIAELRPDAAPPPASDAGAPPRPSPASPTDEPSDEPVDAPTDEPTDEPSDEPVDAPTDAPSDEPVDAPSDEPVDEPSVDAGCSGDAIRLRCAGDVVERCSESGQWLAAGPPCETGCEAGACRVCAFGEFQPPELVTGLGVDLDLWGPALSADGLTLIFAAGSAEDLYVATRAERGSEFSPATPLSSVNSPDSDGTPFLSSDGSSLYFYSLRPGATGGRDLWVSTRGAATSSFGAPVPLSVLNSPDNDHNPWLAPDGLSLIFNSNRSAAVGSEDLWIARRASPGAAFGPPESLGAINTPASEEGAALSGDGLTLFFASDRPGGLGSLDIWVASRGGVAEEFGEPQNLSAINLGSLDLDPALSPGGTELFFSSSRDGGQQLYRAVRSCD